MYFIPATAAALLVRQPSLIRNVRLLFFAFIVFAGCGLLYLYLPIRSLANPPLDWGNPESLQKLLPVLRREQWGKFTWNHNSPVFAYHWLASINLLREFGLGALALAAIGVAYLLRKSAFAAGLLVAWFLSYSILMMWMQAATPVLNNDLIYVLTYNLDEFHIPLYVIVAAFVGLGFAAFSELLVHARLSLSHVRVLLLLLVDPSTSDGSFASPKAIIATTSKLTNMEKSCCVLPWFVDCDAD